MAPARFDASAPPTRDSVTDTEGLPTTGSDPFKFISIRVTPYLPSTYGDSRAGLIYAVSSQNTFNMTLYIDSISQVRARDESRRSPNLLTGCVLIVSEKVRNYLYPVFKKMSPINGCYCSNSSQPLPVISLALDTAL